MFFITERLSRFWRNQMKPVWEKPKKERKLLSWRMSLPGLQAHAMGKNHLVIFRVDDIGDYMLFRDALRLVVFSPKWSGHRITVIGNAIWQPLAAHLDKDLSLNWIWLKKSAWFSDVHFRIQFLQQLNGLQASSVWVPNRTRHALLEETLLLAFKGIPTMVSGDFPKEEKALSRKYFDHRLPEVVVPDPEPVHEWSYNLESAAIFSGMPLVSEPDLPGWNPMISGESYLVFFPGASAGSKRWPAKSFALLGKALWEAWKIPVWLAGSVQDKQLTEEIKEKAGHPDWMVDKSGSTTLPELLDLVRKSRLLVSNDTSAAHMGALAGVPLIALCNGNKKGRFFPYPESFKRVRALYPPGNLQDPASDRLSLKNLRVETVFSACLELGSETENQIG